MRAIGGSGSLQEVSDLVCRDERIRSWLMDIIGGRRFVEVPGGGKHELPPLLLKTLPPANRLQKILDIASDIIEQEDMVPMLDESSGTIESGRLEDMDRRR